MIHGQQYHPHLKFDSKRNLIPAIPPTEVAPSINKLQVLMSSGPDCYDAVQGLIDKYKMPWRIVKDALGNGTLESELTKGELHLQKFLTQDNDMLQMLSDSKKIASSQYEVLITGETGTGKEILANSMIANRTGQTKVVNCAGLPDQLIESELFGHKRGAFTGAISDKEGMMSEAKDGIMFLDEISELPLHLQSKLLRTIQEKSIRKVGSNDEEKINCKFVCASNRDLRKMVEEGKFKQDLYARISTLELHITPLRKRLDDVPLICLSLPNGEKFLQSCGDRLELLNLDCNVRSLIQYVVRYDVLGRLTI